jgi:hypothetical protein
MEAFWGLICVLLLMGAVDYVSNLTFSLKIHEKRHQDYLNKVKDLEFTLKRRDKQIDELKQEQKIGCKRPHVILKTLESRVYSIPIGIPKEDQLKSITPRLIVSKDLYDFMCSNHKIDVGIFHSDMNDLNNGDKVKWFDPYGLYIKNSEDDYIVFETPLMYNQEIQLYCHDEYYNIDYSQFISVTVSRPRVVTINDLSKVSQLYFHAKELIDGSIGLSSKTSLNFSFNHYKKLLETNPYFVCYEYSLINENNIPTFDPNDLVAF